MWTWLDIIEDFCGALSNVTGIELKSDADQIRRA